MKTIACIFLLIALAYGGKDELKTSNFCHKYTITTIGEVSDEKSGVVNGDSILNIKIDTHEDTIKEEPFDITLNFYASKYMVFGYVPLPQAVHDRVGQALATLPNVEYLGKSNVRIECMFKPFPGYGGHCLPPVGTPSQRLVLRPIVDEIKKRIGVLAHLVNGWFKVWVTGKTAFGKEAFCLLVEAKVELS